MLLSVPFLPNIFMKAFILLFLFATLHGAAQNSDETAIRGLLQTQMEAWNRGDVDRFMQTYWKSDSLQFIGRSGIVWGWQKTLDNYKKNYPDRAAMGTLLFDIIEMKKLSDKYYFVTGKWVLHRAVDTPSGFSTLLVRQMNGLWQIVSDHSS